MTASRPTRRGSRPLGWTLVVVLFSGALFALVIRQVDWDVLKGMLLMARPMRLLMVLAVYLVLGLLRAFRFRLILAGLDMPFARMVWITLAHNFAAQVMPLRSGEAVFPLLVHRYGGSRPYQGVSGLVTARLLDMAVVLLGGLVGLALLVYEGRGGDPFALGLMALVTALFLVIVWRVGILTRWLLSAIRWVIKRTPARDHTLLRRVYDQLVLVAEDLKRLRSLRYSVTMFALSIAIYAANAACMALLLATIGITTDLDALIIIVTVVILASSIPLSVSGFGLIEGGWTVALVMFGGVPVKVAASAGVALHALSLVLATLTGGGAFIALQAQRRRGEGASRATTH